MSTRYVWGRYTINKVYDLNRQSSFMTYTFKYSGTPITSQTGYKQYRVGYTGDKYKVIEDSSGTLKIMAMLTDSVLGDDVCVDYDTGLPSIYDQNSGKYFTPDVDGKYSSNETILVSNNDDSNVRWIASLSGDTVRVVRNSQLTGSPPVGKESFYTATAFLKSQEKGSLDGYSSASSRSAYSDNGITDGHWYVYLGADSIDPNSVNYSKQDIHPGDSITISVDYVYPTYNGIISYQYQYSRNGGITWVNLGSKTTDTRKTTTVPELSNQFQVRVQASDNLGFTSSTYVYGQNVIFNVEPSTPSYVTIPNEVYSGDSFQISWGASSDSDGNLAGYEVRKAYDGGSSWQVVSSNVTGTSLTDFVQDGHTSVQYRVRAKDSNGLLSYWAYSNVALIGQMKAYATVGEKNRKVSKMYATVGGKVRQVQKGYVTIGGKIKKLF